MNLHKIPEPDLELLIASSQMVPNFGIRCKLCLIRLIGTILACRSWSLIKDATWYNLLSGCRCAWENLVNHSMYARCVCGHPLGNQEVMASFGSEKIHLTRPALQSGFYQWKVLVGYWLSILPSIVVHSFVFRKWTKATSNLPDTSLFLILEDSFDW